MKRRVFLKNSLCVGAAAGFEPSLSERAFTRESETPREDRIQRVITAMLAMQRYAWEQGVAAQALLEMGEKNLVILMARDAVIRQWPDGRLAVVSDNHGVTDPAANGEPVLYAAEATADTALKEGAEKMLDYLLNKAPRTREGTLHHIDHKPQVWIDSLYMAPPFLARAGRPDEALRQIEGMRKLLWNPEKKLFSQIWDEGKNDFERKDFWGVGNGWAAAGMTRVLKWLPSNMQEERTRLEAYIKDVLDGCLAFRRKDGFFHDVVDNPETFVETNLSQILAYTIYRGVKSGWLENAYLDKAHAMRRAAQTKVDDLGLVRDVCGSPDFQHAGTAVEGQAFFLLMEAACKDLAS